MKNILKNKTIKTWIQRNAQRKQLTKLSDHMLRDIGITRFDVYRESNKFFWEE